MRAARAFLQQADLSEGLEIDLTKNIPLAAGLGGGSGNAAGTLLGLNELFRFPLRSEALAEIAAQIGSDVPFFLQRKPALATGRGEAVQPVEPFAALNNLFILLIHPGFGISTPWSYKSLADFPNALPGKPGRAAALLDALRRGDVAHAKDHFFNTLELPAFRKFPILKLYQDFLLQAGAMVTLMSGSGSTTFAFFSNQASALQAEESFKNKFGERVWSKCLSARFGESS